MPLRFTKSRSITAYLTAQPTLDQRNRNATAANIIDTDRIALDQVTHQWRFHVCLCEDWRFADNAGEQAVARVELGGAVPDFLEEEAIYGEGLDGQKPDALIFERFCPAPG